MRLNHETHEINHETHEILPVSCSLISLRLIYFKYVFSVAYFVVREWLLCLMGRQIRKVLPADSLSVSRDRLLLLLLLQRGFYHTKRVTEWSGILSGKPVPVTTE
jgi:hypothetical protein